MNKNQTLAAKKLREAMGGLRSALRAATSPVEKKQITACMSEIRTVHNELLACEDEVVSPLEEEEVVEEEAAGFPEDEMLTEDDLLADESDLGLDDGMGLDDDVGDMGAMDLGDDESMEDLGLGDDMGELEGDDGMGLDDESMEDLGEDEMMDLGLDEDDMDDEELALSALELAATALKAAAEDDEAAADEEAAGEDEAAAEDDEAAAEDDEVAEEAVGEDEAPAEEAAEEGGDEEVLSDEEMAALEEEGLVETSASVRLAQVQAKLARLMAGSAKKKQPAKKAAPAKKPVKATAKPVRASAPPPRRSPILSPKKAVQRPFAEGQARSLTSGHARLAVSSTGGSRLPFDSGRSHSLPSGNVVPAMIDEEFYEEHQDTPLSAAAYLDHLRSLSSDDRRELLGTDLSAKRMPRSAFRKSHKRAAKNLKRRAFRSPIRVAEKPKNARLPNGQKVKQRFFFSIYDRKGRSISQYWLTEKNGVTSEDADRYSNAHHGAPHPINLPVKSLTQIENLHAKMKK